jgi:hypothetical protein
LGHPKTVYYSLISIFLLFQCSFACVGSSQVAPGNNVGTVATPPYTWDLGTEPVGSYTLYATATDALGATATSAPVTFAVTSAGISSNPIACGETMSGDLTAQDGIGVGGPGFHAIDYTFQSTAGSTYVVTIQSSAFEPSGTLFNFLNAGVPTVDSSTTGVYQMTYTVPNAELAQARTVDQVPMPLQYLRKCLVRIATKVFFDECGIV